MYHGGLRYNRVRHAIFCKKCNDTIESKHDRDFKYCSCGCLAIDGNRILGAATDMEDRSVYCATVLGKKVWLPPTKYQQKANENHKEGSQAEPIDAKSPEAGSQTPCDTERLKDTGGEAAASLAKARDAP